MIEYFFVTVIFFVFSLPVCFKLFIYFISYFVLINLSSIEYFDIFVYFNN